MEWKSFVRRVALGRFLPNEYVCTTPSWIKDPLQIYLKKDGVEVNVTAFQLLLGYLPLTIGLAIRDQELASWAASKPEIQLSFKSSEGEVAWLDLKRLSGWRMGETSLVVYEGFRGAHRFLGKLYSLTNRCYEFFRPHNKEYGSMNTRQYDQVRIAYSVPRRISVISLGDGNRCNFFPTDLLGGLGPGFVAGSLRIGGKACSQVEDLKKIVLSTVGVEAYREVYALAKNHMSDLRLANEFPVADQPSEQWRIPIPKQAIAYQELLWKRSWDSGIHRIHFYEVVNEKALAESEPELSHVHRYYLQWNLGRNLDSKYLIR